MLDMGVAKTAYLVPYYWLLTHFIDADVPAARMSLVFAQCHVSVSVKLEARFMFLVCA